MNPTHARFLEAITDKKKISVRFYSKADNGVLERICAPISYGQGSESHDELDRYWLWDYAGNPYPHILGLLAPEILDLQVRSDLFDPAEFTTQPLLVSVPPTGGLPAATVGSSGGAAGPKL